MPTARTNPYRIANEQTAEILNGLIAALDYYGVESFKRQLSEYANGIRSSNIGDGMSAPLGRLSGHVERACWADHERNED